MTDISTKFNIFTDMINFDGTNIIASLFSGDTMIRFCYKIEDTYKNGMIMFLSNKITETHLVLI